ncbi:MAG: hypothetical protein IJV56_07280 [Neisseriaceae bacterium]|nr:hypothetical protein [Neisseriaceae bacterium]
MNGLDWIIQIVGFSVLACVGLMSATQEPVVFSQPETPFSVDSDTQVEQIPCATADGKQGVLSVVPYWDNTKEPIMVCRELAN